MFTIYDGRAKLYQWDLNRKLIVADSTIKQVHFANCLCSDAKICETYTEGDLTLVNIPNILLQEYLDISVYGYDGEYTKHSTTLEVERRTKPSDYVYTETEVKDWDDLVERMDRTDESVAYAVDKADYATDKVNSLTTKVNEIDVTVTDIADTAAAAMNMAEEALDSAIIPSDNGSVVFNDTVEASGENAVAFGKGTKATNRNAVAFGLNNESNGIHSFTASRNNKANSPCAVVLGENNISPATITITGQTICGKYNAYEDGSINRGLFVVGNGNSDTKRRNAMVVNSDGSAIISGELTAGSIAPATMATTVKVINKEMNSYDDPWFYMEGVQGDYLGQLAIVTNGSSFVLYVCVGSASPYGNGWVEIQSFMA